MPCGMLFISHGWHRWHGLELLARSLAMRGVILCHTENTENTEIFKRTRISQIARITMFHVSSEEGWCYTGSLLSYKRYASNIIFRYLAITLENLLPLFDFASSFKIRSFAFVKFSRSRFKIILVGTK